VARGQGCYQTHKGRLCQNLEGLVPVTKATLTGLQLTTGTIIPAPSLFVPPVEVIDVACGETREIKLYNNTCANESEVSFNALLPRVAWAITCSAGGTLSTTGTLAHWTTGGAFGFVHTPTQTLTYTAPASVPDCLFVPIDVVRAEARGFTRDLLIRVKCGAPPQDPAETPNLSPPGGTTIDVGGSSVPFKVNAFTGTPGATIRMTTDGSNPGPSSPARSMVDLPNNLTTTEQTVVKARAFHPELEPSAVAQQTYVIKAATPALSPPGGTFAEPPFVAITSMTPSGTIRYTLDGSVPTPSSPRYDGPFQVECGQTVTAAVFKDRVVRSDLAQGTYSCTPDPSTCSAFAGFFAAVFSVDSDPGGHAPFVALSTATLEAGVSGSTLSVSGNHPSTVSGTGPLGTSTCTGSATGFGTIAGFMSIRCDYENVVLSASQVTGSYTCGVGGGLPGNQPIRYLFNGPRTGP
jgi:hypothetical protein